MKSDLRFVLDSNVIISALLMNASVPSQAFSCATDHGRILISRELIEELSDVLARDKFNRYVTHEERERFLEKLIREAELVQITETIHVCRDPKDDRLLELALDGKASFLVTGDGDLLVLNPFRGVPIVTPARFLEVVQE